MILVDALNIQQKSSTDSKEFDVGCDLKIANNILIGNIWSYEGNFYIILELNRTIYEWTINNEAFR